MAPFHPTTFRRQFPALQQTGIYLDSAATALKPQAVIDATQQFYAKESGSVHRSQHSSARDVTARFELARQHAATLVNAASAQEMVWVRGTTEAINLVAQSYARPRLQPGDQILVSEAEHHANLIPWLMVAQQTGAQVVKLPIGDDYLPDLTCLANLLNKSTKILALSQMSNVTGGQPNLALAIQLAHAADVRVVVDGAQGIVHCPVDVQQLDIDFYAFSAHKLYGPSGIGALYGKSELLKDMAPWQGGGKMLTHASFSGFTPQKAPHCFEAGTPNIAGVLGLGAVLEWLAGQDWRAAEQHSSALADYAEQQLQQLPGWRSFRCSNASLLAFNIAGLHPGDIATLLAEQNVAVRAGQHCAQPLMAALGIEGCVRASFAPYNSAEEVEAFVQAMIKVVELLAD
ncbi:cysteine desulfurase CsdA [Serratia microhaemolytica]|uniref:cysteine desulfurase CsdA n=1 Tax=Serratia microhaemolytica TaxID=2675110 RepID=UPI000FDDC3D8|nr:cysteine desulfurase CsdA [Serratia microhaemolytica]